MKFKNFFAVMTAALFSAALLAGCGDSDDDKKSDKKSKKNSSDSVSLDIEGFGDYGDDDYDYDYDDDDDDIPRTSGSYYDDDDDDIPRTSGSYYDDDDDIPRTSGSYYDDDDDDIPRTSGSYYDDDDDDDIPRTSGSYYDDDDDYYDYNDFSDYSSDSSVIGKWETKTLTSGTTSIDGDNVVSGISVKLILQMEFFSDGTCDLYSMGSKQGSGTWKMSGSKVSVKADGDTVNFTLSGGLLTGTIETSTFTLKKVSTLSK